MSAALSEKHPTPPKKNVFKPDLFVLLEIDYNLPGDASNAAEQEQSRTDSTSFIVLPFISVSVTEVTMCHVKQLGSILYDFN